MTIINSGWGARIRTWECRYQKPVPYHLATPQLRGGHSQSVFALQQQIHCDVKLNCNSTVSSEMTELSAAPKSFPFDKHYLKHHIVIR